jgi:hemerythrin-like metal-binding protein
MPLPWKDEYSLGIKVIDEQHKKFVAALNHLYEAVNTMKARKELRQIFLEIEDYAHFHFATEEKYFDQFKYEDAAEHKTKHNEFREKLSAFENRIENNEIEVSFSLIDFLEDWLIGHISDVDKKYVQCFKDHGLK